MPELKDHTTLRLGGPARRVPPERIDEGPEPRALADLDEERVRAVARVEVVDLGARRPEQPRPLAERAHAVRPRLAGRHRPRDREQLGLGR